jgi:hypothetical protein
MEGHSGNIFFYPVAFLIGTFPWSLWLIPVLLWIRSVVFTAPNPDSGSKNLHSSPVTTQLLTLAAVWVAVYLGAFTIASTKLPSYISPCYPGAALAVGCYLRHFEMNWYAPGRFLRYTAYSITTLVGAAICFVLVFLSREQSMPMLSSAAISGAVIAGLGIFGFACEIFGRSYHWNSRAIPVAWLIAAGCFNVIIFGFGTKSVDQYRGDLAILRSAAEASPEDTQWISIGGMEPSWVYYLDSNIAEVRRNARMPDAWEQVKERLNEQGATNIIVVGDEAIAKMSSATNPLQAYQVEELERTGRFLREGQLAIFQVTATQGSTTAVAESTQRPSVQESPTIETAMQEMPVEFSFSQAANSGSADHPTVGEAAEEPAAKNPADEAKARTADRSLRSGTGGNNGPYNPLRPNENRREIR